MLDLAINMLTNTIPPAVSQLTAIKRIFLDHNFLIGQIPDLSAQAVLVHLILSENDLSGTFPAAIWSLSDLVTISLFNNENLRGSIPSMAGMV